MVIRIVKNQTPSPISLDDLGMIIPASGQVDLGLSCDAQELANSDSLAIQLGNGNLILDIGEGDVSLPRALDIVRNIPQYFKTTADAKLVVNSTPQPSNTTDFCLTGRTDGRAGEGGQLLHIDHTVFQFGIDTQGIDKPCGLFVDNGGGVEGSQYWLNTRYIDLNVLGNRTYFFDGGIMWRGLSDNGNNGLMSVSLEAVSSVFDPSPFEVTPGEGNAVIVDGYLVVPVPGLVGGTHQLPLGQTPDQTPQPFYMTAITPMALTGKYWCPGFWQIDYDLVEGKFFNLLPCEDPYAEVRNNFTGLPNVVRIFGNIFTVEIPLMSFVKDLLVVGNSSNFFPVCSNDASEIGHGVRVRMDCKTLVHNGIHQNCPWTMVGYMKLYRERTT